MHISLSSPDISSEEMAIVKGVLRSGSLSIGDKLTKFEESFCAYIGSEYAIGVTNGTSGLHLSILAAGVGENDLVITSPYSFIASANCFLYEKAIPIFIDVEADTGNIRPDLIEECLHDIERSKKYIQKYLPPSYKCMANNRSARLKVKCMIIVHIYGQPAQIGQIKQISQEHDIWLIEDACEAIGAKHNNEKVGRFGDAAVFGFYPNKQMTTGEGGMIVTNREDWDVLLRSLRNQGRDKSGDWLSHSRLGYNYRLDEMSAALGLAQLMRIEELLSKRERVAAWYNERLKSLESITLLNLAQATTRMSWFVYVIRAYDTKCRNYIVNALKEIGIPSRIYFSPIHLQPYYMSTFGYRRGDFPVAEHLGDVSLALPFSSTMTKSQVDYVCDNLRKCVSKYWRR